MDSNINGDSAEIKVFDQFLGCWNYNTQMHLWRYVFAGKYVHQKRVIDIASGVGYGTRYLAEQGARLVFGIDLDANALGYAYQNYDAANILYVHGNGLELPFKNDSIDVVVSFETIEHIPVNQQEAFIAEVHRILKPQGVFLCSSLNHQYSPGHADHTREFFPDELFGMIRYYFKNTQEYGQFISLNDLKFQQEQVGKLGFKFRRKRNIFVRRLGVWFRETPERIVMRDNIKKIFGRKGYVKPVRTPVYITDPLISTLNPQYAPIPVETNTSGILFDSVAIGHK